MERSTTQYQSITDREAARGRTRGSSAGHEPGTRRNRWRRWGIASLLLVLALPAALAGVVTVERITLPPLQVSLPGTAPAISGDGRFVVFVVEGRGIYVQDRQTGTTERVGDGVSPAISDNGRYVAFQSDGIFVWDRETGKTTPINVPSSGEPANGHSEGPSISGDGRFVAFVSSATNLVPGDTNNAVDIFVRDWQNGRTELVSVSPSGAPANSDSNSSPPALSDDGRYVAFASDASNLVPGDTNGFLDVFVRDRESGTTERVSVIASGGQSNGWSAVASISGDGRFVAFQSGANNLVPGPTSVKSDIFVRDRELRTTERVNVTTSGARATGESEFPAISGDGRYVAFASNAGNLVPGDTNGQWDLFVRDRQTGTTEFVPVSAEWINTVAISADGRFVAFTFSKGSPRAVVRDRVAATNELIAVALDVDQTPMDSGEPAISADGRFVAFLSSATNLGPADTNERPDIYRRDLETGTTELVSVTADGSPANGASSSPAISRDGSIVAFASYASNLVPGDTNGAQDIFLRDRRTGRTERVSVSSRGEPTNGHSQSPAISADGRFVAFQSGADNLVAGDTNGEPDIFVRDRETGTTELVSVSSSGAPANGWSGSPAISGDGQVVAFVSLADNLAGGGSGGGEEIYVRDRRTGRTERVSVSAGGGAPTGASVAAAISGDGRFVAFASEADDLVVGDTNGGVDIFVRELATGQTERASVSTSGEAANGWSGFPVLSADGRYVAFVSEASNLVPGDTNGRADVFVVERE